MYTLKACKSRLFLLLFQQRKNFIINRMCLKHWPVRVQLAARDENVQLWPKNLDSLGEKSIFCMVIVIFVSRAYYRYAQGYNFLIQTTLKEISVFELWVIFWSSPLFLATVRAIKTMTQNDNGPGPGRNCGETAVFTFSRKVFFLAKNAFYPQQTPRVAEVAREHGWPPPKSLDSDENFKPELTLFCRELRFVSRFTHFFWEIFGHKKCLFG